MNRSKRCFQSGHSLRSRVGWNSTFLLLYSSRHVTTKKVSRVHSWTNNRIGLANRIELNDYLDELFLKKKISYRRESFIHLNQGLFYENLLWSSLWAGKVIASKFKIFVMKMSECARLSVAAMVCVNLVALSSKNWSQIKHLLSSSLLVSLIYRMIFVKITNCWVWSATKGHRAFKSDAWFITMAIDNQWPNNYQNKFGNLGTVSSKVTDQFEPYRWVKLESS